MQIPSYRAWRERKGTELLCSFMLCFFKPLRSQPKHLSSRGVTSIPHGLGTVHHGDMVKWILQLQNTLLREGSHGLIWKMIISQNISVILTVQFRANNNTVMVSSFILLAAPPPFFCNTKSIFIFRFITNRHRLIKCPL